MNTVISFTPAMLWSALLGICAAIAAISGAISVVARVIKHAQQPNKLQDKRIDELEKRIDRHDELFLNDKRSIERLESGTRVTQKAILALLDHGLDGNNTKQMQAAKEELQSFLLER